MAEAPRILVLTASAGAGHLVAAEALADAVRRVRPDVHVRVHDVLASATGLFRRLYGGGYLLLARRAPEVFGWLYDATDRPAKGWTQRVRRGFQWSQLRRTVREIVAYDPALILHTHFLPAELVAHLRSRGSLSCPHAVVTTDFEAHRLWYVAPCERWYVASELAAEQLRRWGAAAGAIRVTGIPVRRAFSEPTDRALARARLGLAVERPVVLVLCGGFGVGPAGQIVQELRRHCPAAEHVVICGHNAALERQLRRRFGDAVRIVGYTGQMHLWMRAADVAVGKAGGLTVCEALVAELPMVIFQPIPGPESRNSDFLLERGAAVRANHLRLVGYRVARLLAERQKLLTMRWAARGLARPAAATTIARDALSLLETPVRVPHRAMALQRRDAGGARRDAVGACSGG